MQIPTYSSRFRGEMSSVSAVFPAKSLMLCCHSTTDLYTTRLYGVVVLHVGTGGGQGKMLP